LTNELFIFFFEFGDDFSGSNLNNLLFLIPIILLLFALLLLFGFVLLFLFFFRLFFFVITVFGSCDVESLIEGFDVSWWLT